MESQQIQELIEVFKNLIEKSSDRNGCLTELAKARVALVTPLDDMSFNPNGADINGNQSKYKAMNEQADKIDELIRFIVSSEKEKPQ